MAKQPDTTLILDVGSLNARIGFAAERRPHWIRPSYHDNVPAVRDKIICDWDVLGDTW